MSIYEPDALFNEAYRLHTVEEDDPAAINLCRKALEMDPNHYRARVFLGILLSDLEGAQEKIEGRKHFVEAIKRAANPSVFCSTWPEEAAVQHLGIWEWGQGKKYEACLFFLVDFLACKNEVSYDYLIELLNELDPDLASVLKLLLDRLTNKSVALLKD